jgi:hypothetical protein
MVTCCSLLKSCFVLPWQSLLVQENMISFLRHGMVAWAQSTGDQEYPVLRCDEPRIVVECFMRLDRLDFLVENLARFWKNAHKCLVLNQFLTSSFHRVLLQRYIEKADLEVNSTICKRRLHFCHLKVDESRNRWENLTILSLAATMASTILVGFGTLGSIKIHLLSVKANSDWTTEGSQRWRQWRRIQQEYGY